MKNLELTRMEQIEGGRFGSDFWDGACGGVVVVGLAFAVGAVTLGAGAGLLVGVASAVCYARSIIPSLL